MSNGGRVVKGVQFENLRDAGDPAELAKAHSASGADEIVLLDISASHEHRTTLLDTVRRAARQLFIPFTVGGGIRTLEDAARGIFGGRGQDQHQFRGACRSDRDHGDRGALRFAGRGRGDRRQAARGHRRTGRRSPTAGARPPAATRSRGRRKRSRAGRAKFC